MQSSMQPFPSSSKNLVEHLVQIEADEQATQSDIFPPEELHFKHFLSPLVVSDQILGSIS